MSTKKQGLQIHKFVKKDLSNSLRYFCDQINNSDADLFVVLAQKAVCLFQILLSQNLLKNDICTKYITSHALDFCLVNELKHFKGKIALIDDIMVTGYSISHIANILVRSGVPAENIQIIALVRDTTYQTIQFTDLLSCKSKFYCAVETEDLQCTDLSYQICKTLTYYCKPYDSDFPVYQESKAETLKALSWMNPSLWTSYETTPAHAPSGVSSWTMFPKELWKDRLWKLLGISIDKYVHLKVRLYIKEYPDGSNDITFVPMALFHEISAADLIRLYPLLIQHPLEEMTRACTLRAKVRLLQYYIAHCLYIAASDLMIGLSVHGPSINDMQILFGCQIAEQIQVQLKNVKKSSAHISPFEAKACEIDLLGYTKQRNTFDMQSIFKLDDQYAYELTSELLKPFEYWNKTQEFPSRTEIAKKPRHYLNDSEEIEKIRNHLNTGFSLHALQRIIYPAQGYFNSEHLVSVFLDRAIDNGLIVPVLYEYKDGTSKEPCICQAYRHGEDLPYGHADKERLLYFLKQLDVYMRDLNGGLSESIAFVTLHKMVALFYQLGLKRGSLFNRFLGFGNDPFLQERFCVHGIVQTIRNNSPFSDAPPFYASAEDENNVNEEPLTKFLVHKLCVEGFIDEEKSTYKRYIIQTDKIDDFVSQKREDGNNSPFGVLSEDVAENIELIARIIASWYVWKYSSGGDRVKDTFKKDITCLTSCADIYLFASAIGTEVHYFKRYWTQNAKDVLRRIIGGEECSGEEFCNPSTKQAMYSGREKNDFFKSRRVLKVINEVTHFLEEVREYLKNTQTTPEAKLKIDGKMSDAINLWKDSWKGLTVSGTPTLQEATEQLVKYHYFYSVCYEWLECGGATSKSDILIENSDSYQAYAAHYPQEAKNKLDFFKELIKDNSKDHSERAKKFIKTIDVKVRKSEELINSIIEELAGKSDSYTIQYDSVLLLSIAETDVEVSDQMLRDVWKALPENAEKTRFNMIHLFSEDNTYQQYGIFYNDPYAEEDSTPYNMGDWPCRQLFRFYKEFLPIAYKGAYATSAVLVPHLPPDAVFSHNLRRNVEKHAANFKTHFADPLLASLPPVSHVHQIQLVLTPYTTVEQAQNYVRVLETLPGFKKYSDLTSLCISEPEDVSKFAKFVVDIQLGNPVLPIVKILHDEYIVGTGFLFRNQGKIFCITCQHLLDGNSKDTFLAQLSNGQVLPLTPLNYTLLTSRRAAEEVLILGLKYDVSMPYDGSAAFSMKRWGAPKLGQTYSCLGYPKGLVHGHSLTIQTKAFVLDGYVQGESDSEVSAGYSGAGLIGADSKLYGMHTSHPNENPHSSLFVPAQTIINILTSQ